MSSTDDLNHEGLITMKHLILAATIIGSLFFGVNLNTHALADTPTPILHGVVRIAATHPCPTEDSVNCYWDAGSSGNGRGHSFYSIRVGGLTAKGRPITRDCVIYWGRAYNRTHGQCYRS